MSPRNQAPVKDALPCSGSPQLESPLLSALGSMWNAQSCVRATPRGSLQAISLWVCCAGSHTLFKGAWSHQLNLLPWQGPPAAHRGLTSFGLIPPFLPTVLELRPQGPLGRGLRCTALQKILLGGRVARQRRWASANTGLKDNGRAGISLTLGP